MSRKTGNSANNTVRIIGGRWRRRKLQFPPIEGLRPTPDRVRETIFNWLHLQLPGARVLDAYCGSGALGLESLSRGASEAVFIDSSAQVCDQLTLHLDALQANNAAICQQPFLRWAAQAGNQQKPFDIVFLDPPYNERLLQASIDAVIESGLLAADGFLYIEHETGSEPLLSERLLIRKTLKTGNNQYQLGCLLPTERDSGNC